MLAKRTTMTMMTGKMNSFGDDEQSGISPEERCPQIERGRHFFFFFFFFIRLGGESARKHFPFVDQGATCFVNRGCSIVTPKFEMARNLTYKIDCANN